MGWWLKASTDFCCTNRRSSPRTQATFTRFSHPSTKELANYEPRDPVDAPTSLVEWKGTPYSEELDLFELLPKRPDGRWGLAARWQPGEDGALARLIAFLDDSLEGYAENRDKPGEDGTSCLSPHLAHGEITPARIMAALQRKQSRDAETFRKELAWREFSYHLLFHHPELYDARASVPHSMRSNGEAHPLR